MKKTNTTPIGPPAPNRRFLFTFKGSGNAYGPIFAPDELTAKRQIKRNWELPSIRNIEVWEQTQEQADQIAESNRQMYEEVADKATHLTLLDFF